MCAVGSTTGFMDPAFKWSARFNLFSAFLMELNADLSVNIWAKQVFEQPSKGHELQDALYVGCAVDPKGSENDVCQWLAHKIIFLECLSNVLK